MSRALSIPRQPSAVDIRRRRRASRPLRGWVARDRPFAWDWYDQRHVSHGQLFLYVKGCAKTERRELVVVGEVLHARGPISRDLEPGLRLEDLAWMWDSPEPPTGLVVFTGFANRAGHQNDCPHDMDVVLFGRFRPATSFERRRLARGRVPWRATQ